MVKTMYIDLLTQLKNAQKAKKDSIKVAYSNMDLAVMEILAKLGFVGSVVKKGRMPKRVLEVELSYPEGRGAITGIKFVSTPGRRIYAGYEDLRPVKQGFGTAIISTSKGVMTSKEARKEKLGGQVLFEIW